MQTAEKITLPTTPSKAAAAAKPATATAPNTKVAKQTTQPARKINQTLSFAELTTRQVPSSSSKTAPPPAAALSQATTREEILNALFLELFNFLI